MEKDKNIITGMIFSLFCFYILHVLSILYIVHFPLDLTTVYVTEVNLIEVVSLFYNLLSVLQSVTDHPNQKRKWCITWDQYFMGVALITAQRSKDPVTQVELT